MKQNKKYIVVFLLIILIIGVLSISAFAEFDSSGVAPIVTQSSTLDQYLHILSYPYAGMQTYLGTVSGYSFAFHIGSNMVVASTPDTVLNFIYNGGLSWNPTDNFGVYDSTYDLYYSSWSNLGGTWYVPSYNSLNDGLSDIRAYVDANGGGSSSGSCVVIPTSYTTITSDRWIKASITNVSGLAYYFDGEYYNLVVANINANNYINMATENSQSPVGLYQVTVIDGVTVYYNDNVTRVSESDTSELGYFTSVTDAVSAIYNMLDEGGAVPTAPAQNALNLNLNPGNVAYIDISGTANNYANITVNLTAAAYYTLSDFQARMNYMYGFSNTIPSSFSLPISGTSSIRWEPNSKPTVTGTYNSFKASIPYNASEGNYLIIVNPVYENIDVNSTTIFDINAYNVNNVLNIQCICNNYYIYSLSVAISYSDGQSHYESGDSTSQYIGTYNPTTQQWETINAATGQPETPSYGGDVQQPEFTAEQEAKKFTSWLKEFLQGFISIFDAGKSSITTLVGYATPFFTAIASLYSWLPSPVYTVLISGLSLVITVGIIKVFL